MDDSPLTILICDDNAEIRSLLRSVFDGESGVRVVGEAVDGEAAIREASRLRPDVILLDLAMPVLSGLDALPRLRNLDRDAKIIVFSGFSTSMVADRVFALGADGYLEKGVEIETILATIRNVRASRLIR